MTAPSAVAAAALSNTEHVSSAGAASSRGAAAAAAASRCAAPAAPAQRWPPDNNEQGSHGDACLQVCTVLLGVDLQMRQHEGQEAQQQLVASCWVCRQCCRVVCGHRGLWVHQNKHVKAGISMPPSQASSCGACKRAHTCFSCVDSWSNRASSLALSCLERLPASANLRREDLLSEATDIGELPGDGADVPLERLPVV